MVRNISQLFQLIFACGNATLTVVLHSCVVEVAAIASMHLPVIVCFKSCSRKSLKRPKTMIQIKNLAALVSNKGSNSCGSLHGDGRVTAAALVHEAKLLDVHQPYIYIYIYIYIYNFSKKKIFYSIN